jgi:hypothetical protein
MLGEAQITLVLKKAQDGTSVGKVCRKTGIYPTSIQVDQGSELISRDLDLWAYTRGVTLDFSRPGKPTNTMRSSSPPTGCSARSA